MARDGDYSTMIAEKLVTTQAAPRGTWETWPGDFPGSGTEFAKDEGHYYMECSNAGMCLRDTECATAFQATLESHALG